MPRDVRVCVLKIETLTKRQDFIRIAARGHRYVTPAFIVQVAQNPFSPTDIIRVGYTASRKIGSAVYRNRAKRRLRALAQEICQEHGLPGYDYVFVARGYILNRGYEKMKNEMQQALLNYKELVNA